MEMMFYEGKKWLYTAIFILFIVRLISHQEVKT